MESSQIPFTYTAAAVAASTSPVARYSPTSLPPSEESLPSINYNNRKTRFVVLLKKLLDMLRENGEIVLLEQCKLAVLHCTHRNRLGDPAYTPLVECTARRLHRLVGPLRWEIAKTETSLYFAKRDTAMRGGQQQQIRRRSSSLTNNPTGLTYHGIPLSPV